MATLPNDIPQINLPPCATVTDYYRAIRDSLTEPYDGHDADRAEVDDEAAERYERRCNADHAHRDGRGEYR